MAFSSADFGSVCCATSATCRPTSITCISIRSSMAGRRGQKIGRIRRSIAMFEMVCFRLIGVFLRRASCWLNPLAGNRCREGVGRVLTRHPCRRKVAGGSRPALCKSKQQAVTPKPAWERYHIPQVLSSISPEPGAIRWPTSPFAIFLTRFTGR